MKKKLCLYLCMVLLLFALSLTAEGAEQFFVNSGTALDMALSEAYAVGGDGSLGQIGGGERFALTARGVEQLTGEVNYVGGGGLRYDDATLIIPSDQVRVGLAYYYSDARDSSLDEARLENAVGSGYQFGTFDENRKFVPYLNNDGQPLQTSSTRLTMRPLGNTSVGVYDTDTWEGLFWLPASGADSYLVIHPVTQEGETAQTWFSGRKYCGDFAYADLGNGKLTVVNQVDMEHYTMGVISQEMGTAFPLEALKAQAVAARSYAMYQILSSINTYHTECGFDLTNDTYSQAYGGYTYHVGEQSFPEVLIRATRETENQYLTYRGAVCDALYSAAHGGHSLNSEDAGYGWVYVPYLRGIEDPYEGDVWDPERGPYGHQVGMSQWGAYSMAKNYGKTYKDILGFYYTEVGLSYGKILTD